MIFMTAGRITEWVKRRRAALDNWREGRRIKKAQERIHDIRNARGAEKAKLDSILRSKNSKKYFYISENGDLMGVMKNDSGEIEVRNISKTVKNMDRIISKGMSEVEDIHYMKTDGEADAEMRILKKHINDFISDGKKYEAELKKAVKEKDSKRISEKEDILDDVLIYNIINLVRMEQIRTELKRRK